MEQNYKQIGSTILNPARLWKNVLAEPPRRYPTIVLYNRFPGEDEVIRKIISYEWEDCPKFIVFSETKFPVPVEVSFYLYNQLRDDDRISMWKKVDILYTTNTLLGYEAGLSGVNVVHSEEELHALLVNGWVGSPQRRVEAFDKTCRLLDTE